MLKGYAQENPCHYLNIDECTAPKFDQLIQI